MVHREGSKGTIEGPFYAPGAPQFGPEATLPMRDGERGTPMLFRGQVRAVDGNPLGGATIDIWHCDDEGYYALGATVDVPTRSGRLASSREAAPAITKEPPGATSPAGPMPLRVDS